MPIDINSRLRKVVKKVFVAINISINNFSNILTKNLLASVLIGFISSFFVLFEILNYYHFNFPVLDLGMYNRHMWGLIRFDFGANPLKGFNLLGDHAHFILLFFAPLYFLFPSPITLLVLQALSIGLSGWPIYLIANKFFKNKSLAAIFLLPYYCFFGFWAAMVFPFHVSVLAILPLSWALYFLLTKKYRKLVYALIVLILIKEDMPLVVFMFALYLIIIDRKTKLGLILAVVSIPYFLFVVKFWLPFVSKIRYYYTDTSLGMDFKDIIIIIFTKPIAFIKAMLMPSMKIKTIFCMLLSFGGFSLIGLEILILLCPLWLGRFLSTQEWRWSIIQHYSANQGPILAVAALVGVHRLSFFLKNKKVKTYFNILFIIICLIGNGIFYYHFKPKEYLKIFNKNFYTFDSHEKELFNIIKQIPSESSAGVQSSFPQLTSRQEVYLLPIDFSKVKPDFLLFDTHKDFWPMKTKEDVINQIKIATDNGYLIKKQIDDIYLLQKE
ncbi:MAG: DUF2079 domain-containing protein [Patescibacteria group bacterium]|nr:DUF2079 domain-containing protein [Patescibacteria group bacterium]